VPTVRKPLTTPTGPSKKATEQVRAAPLAGSASAINTPRRAQRASQRPTATAQPQPLPSHPVDSQPIAYQPQIAQVWAQLAAVPGASPFDSGNGSTGGAGWHLTMSLPVPPGIAVKRSDQGRDYQGTPGQRIVAIGRARVDAVKDDPGGFGKVVYYTLLEGPSKGQQIYVGHAQPNVRAGQVIGAGKPVATLLKSSLGNAAGMPGWVEIGLARGGAPMYPSNGARPLEKLLRGASTAPSTQPDQTTSTAPAVAQALDLNANISPPDSSPTAHCNGSSAA